MQERDTLAVQLKAARAQASASAAQAEQAHQTFLQVMGAAVEQLRFAGIIVSRCCNY